MGDNQVVLSEEQINQRIQQLTTAIQQVTTQTAQMQINVLRLQGELDAWTKIKRQMNSASDESTVHD